VTRDSVRKNQNVWAGELKDNCINKETNLSLVHHKLDVALLHSRIVDLTVVVLNRAARKTSQFHLPKPFIGLEEHLPFPDV
jgi:hypothetical protein